MGRGGKARERKGEKKGREREVVSKEKNRNVDKRTKVRGGKRREGGLEYLLETKVGESTRKDR